MPTKRVLFVLSDGEHTVNTDRQAIIDAASTFKAAGGIVVAMGLKAAGNGFDLLSRIASPGFFINAHTLPQAKSPVHSFNQLAYLKSVLCVGRCVPTGDLYVNEPALTYDFPSTSLWEVPQGLVHLLGPGLLDLLPGNGLYLDMAGGSPAILRTIDSYEMKADRDYEITVFAAGNQRENIAGQQLKVYLRAIGAAETDPNLFERIIAPAWNQDFTEFSFVFNSIADVPVKVYVEQLYTGSAPVLGNLLDRVIFTDVSTNTTLLDEDFDNENLTYNPPRCGPSVERAEITDPEAPTAEVYFESGGSLVPDLGYATEGYQYAVSYVTLEGETAATRLQISGANTTVSGLDSVILLQMPVPDDARVLSKRIWRSLGADGDFYDPDVLNLYLLAEVDPRQVNYLDSERSDDFGDRYDNTVTAPTANTTLVTAGELGVGSAECCYYEYDVAGTLPLVPEMTDNDTPVGDHATTGSTAVAAADAWLAFHRVPALGTPIWIGVNDFATGVVPANEWIKMEFPTAQTVTAYSFNTHNSMAEQLAPWAWILEGSNDDSNWTQVASESGVTDWVYGVDKTFTVATPGSYLFYRLTPTLAGPPNEDGGFNITSLQYYGGTTGAPLFTDECQDCTAEAPAAQEPELEPLLNNETTDPPLVVNSTKQVCVFCGPEQQLVTNVIPAMTSNVLPSGIASATSEAATTNAAWHAFDGNTASFWQSTRTDAPWRLSYAFTEATTVNYYRIFPGGACPTAWTFEGSNDGSTWTVLDTQAVPVWSGFAQEFFPAEPASYKQYRLNISKSFGNSVNTVVQIVSFELLQVQAVAKSCATAVGSGSTPAEADADAIRLATIEANKLLDCKAVWTSTVSYTARCTDIGALGTAITRESTKTSLISFNDAHTQAYDEAKAAAEEELVCTDSNNEQQINITDFTSGDMAKAAPYPSVKYVTGGPASITKVVVHINGFTHGFPDDVRIALRSPEGTVVELMRNCGGTPSVASAVSNIDLVFDSTVVNPLPDGAGMVAGTFNPTVFGAFAPYPSPLGTYVILTPGSPPVLDGSTPYGTDLGAFATEDANGSWSLWVCDDLTFFTGSIKSWDLTIM